MQLAQRVLCDRWMAADFRTRQLPILAIAAAIWASTAWIAGRTEDSATPLLRNSLAAAQSQHPSGLAGSGSPTMIAGPADPAGAMRAESRAGQTLPSLSLNQIMDFLLSETTPRRERLANPQVQVWADTHTGLYYCPGKSGYRRSSRGHFMSQKEAQRNYFQPAAGAACP
jgi:hypothetical protein